MKTRWAVCLVAPLSACAPGGFGAPKPAIIDAAVKAEMARQHIPGVAVAVLRGNKVVFAKGYGVADAETRTPVTTATLFEIGSITKQFTATAVMMLVEAGKVSQDGTIGSYLSGLPEAWSGVTVRQLLTHTSGIPNYTAQPEFTWSRDYTPDEILKLASGKPMDFTPGERWNYSNTGYYLLGMLVEKVSGQPLARFFSERIFKPLGMTRTRLGDVHEIVIGRARGYAWEGRLVNAPLLHRGAAGGAGSILSSVDDMSRWAAALSTPRLLKPESRKAMWARARLNDGSLSNYGYGWAIGNRNGHPLVDHGGGTAGFSTMISRYPGDNLMVIVLTNSSAGGAGAIDDAVSAMYVPALARRPLKAAAKDPDPATTARIRAVVLNLLSDKPDMSPFTEKMKAVLTPAMVSSVREQMHQMGPLKSFAYVSDKAIPDGRSYVYSAVFGKTPLVIHATIARDGKISGLLAGPS